MRKHPLGPDLSDAQPFDHQPAEARMRLPVSLEPFLFGHGPLTQWEAEFVRGVLRRIFAPPRPREAPRPDMHFQE